MVLERGLALLGWPLTPLAPIGVLLAVLVSELAIVPYKLWRKRLRATGPAASGHAPTGAH